MIKHPKINLLIIVLLSFFSIPPLRAQDCKCLQELDFVIDYYETNLPGFADNVNADNAPYYEKFKADLRSKTALFCQDKGECFKLLTLYVEFFKDNHSGIYFNEQTPVNEKDKESLNHFLQSKLFLNREKVDLKNISIPKNALTNIENVYHYKDSTYTVAILKSPNEIRDYIGVIVDSRTPLWKKGQVKFELKQTGNNQFDMFLYLRNHSVMYIKNADFKDGVLAGDWCNSQMKSHHLYSTEVPFQLIYKEIDPTTNYIHIPTFSGNWIAKLDSFYRKNDSIIRSRPNLIIDLRNNGGGSDYNANPLLPYIYTKPFYSDNVDLYVTDENIRKSIEWYDENKADTVNFDQTFMNEILHEINEMQQAPKGSFIPRAKSQQIELDTVLANPSRVAVIMNRHCASSCEAFLFWAKESDKTILLGENSGGYVGYGEISSVHTPHFNFELGCTMTRYDKQLAFEVVGISPDYYLDNNSNWVEQTIEIMRKQ